MLKAKRVINRFLLIFTAVLVLAVGSVGAPVMAGDCTSGSTGSCTGI